MQGLASSYNAHLTHGGPPVLPMYKSLGRKRAPQQTLFTTIPIIIFLCGFLGFFFCSIYIGASYLHDHLQDEKWGNTIGLPGTRNVIQKWSVAHLGGIDLTQLGPPRDRAASTATSKFVPPFQAMFKSAFGSKAMVESNEEAIKSEALNNAKSVEVIDPVPIDGEALESEDSKEQGFSRLSREKIVDSESKERSLTTEEKEEEGEEVESMDGDSKEDGFLKEENDETGKEEQEEIVENEIETDEVNQEEVEEGDVSENQSEEELQGEVVEEVEGEENQEEILRNETEEEVGEEVEGEENQEEILRNDTEEEVGEETEGIEEGEELVEEKINAFDTIEEEGDIQV